MNSQSTSLLTVFLLCICVTVNTPSHAQDQVTSTRDPIETIVVSATRSEQSLDQSPGNISVLNQEQLARTQAEHIQQHLSQIPGVSLQRGDGQESLPGIRSAVQTGAGACASVLVMEQGLPVRGPAFCNVNELFDTHFEQASRIEVTRGPGTSFYGSNSLTGSINVSLPARGRDYVSLEVGEQQFRRLKGALSYGDNAAGRVYLTSTDTNSFRQDSGYSQHKLSWRHQQSLGHWNVDAGLTFTQLDQETAGFITGLNSYRDASLSRQNLDPEAFRETQSLRAWGRFSSESESGRQLQFTPYLRATDMDFLLHFLPGDPLEQNQQFGVGWQSSLRGNWNQNLHWAVGFDADFSQGELRQTQDAPTPGSAFLRETIPTGVHYDYEVDARQLGVFTHLDWRLNPDTSMLFGVRAERLDYDYDNRALDGRTRSDGTACGFGGCRYSRPADRSDSFTELSPKLELRYRFNDVARVYAAVATSFRAPQATELYRLQRQQQVADLDSVRADNIEVGMSYRANSLRFAVALYQLKQENVIIRDSNFFNVDGSRTESRGLELSLEKTISDSLFWRFAGAVAEHQYASDQLSGGININGNDIDTAPKIQFNTALEWTINEAVSAELEWQRVDEYYLEPENLREYEGHDVLNLRLGYQLSPQLSVSARVLNLADQRYAERADFTQFTDERYFPGAPRTVYLGLRYDFTNSSL